MNIIKQNRLKEKLVKISLEGEIAQGYKVRLVEIKDESDGRILYGEVEGSLTSALEIYHTFQQWQQKYKQLEKLGGVRELRKRGKKKIPAHTSIRECADLATNLKIRFNEWLDNRDFQALENIIRSVLNPGEVIRFILQTKDYNLWRLPWSEWDFFKLYRKAEVAFSSLEFRDVEKTVVSTPKKNVKILTVWGDNDGIDYQQEQETFKRLSSTGVKQEGLKQPTAKKVRERLLYKPWDILFFAGHSDSEADIQTGRVHLSSSDILTPDNLENTLRTAVEKGLKIAIFNSCEGLGLARQLVAEFQIPVVIAMREPVPNRVAQNFLEYFLLEYAYRKQPLYVAVRKARETIAEDEKLQKQLPGIDWLPVIVQNPAIRPPTWEELHRPVSIAEVGMASLACTSLVMLARFFGLLQPIELSTFDKLMQMRPLVKVEQEDPRLLIVTVTEEDIKQTKEYPIKDKTLERVLRNLEQYEPRVIGLDIYRDVPQGEGHNDLIKHLKESDRVIPICRLQEPTSDNAANIGVSPPSGVPVDRLGFDDLPQDEDGTIRLQLLTSQPDKKDSCQTPLSLSFQLASSYLKKEKSIDINIQEEDNYLQFNQQGSPKFKILQSHTGGYQKLTQEEIGGFQVLLNYRATNKIAQEVSLSQVFNNEIDPNWVIDRVVLIGYTATSVAQDIHSTPINSEMPGVIIHAHMVSQILSAVLDGRSLLWAWPWWGDFLWVWGWSLLGGLLIWFNQRLFILVLIEGAIFIALPVLCLIILIKGGWMPLIPSFGALVFTVGSLMVYIVYPTLQQN